MRVSGDWLDHSGTQALCLALERAGYQALFVGGCVRNSLLGVAVSDIDLATDARPEKVSLVATDCGFKVVPTGIEHGTLTVVAGGKPHEVTTFRRDVETDGRHAVVTFSDDLAEDAQRRDFTMNALYANRQGQVIDPLSGLADLSARRVRFVGKAEDRIREDYLRILRFFRFHAQHGDPAGGLDADGLAACAMLADGLSGLSKERIGAEVRKLLAAADPAPSVAAMAQAGILARCLPGADPVALAPLVHLEDGQPPRWQRRLAVLGGDESADALRLSRSQVRELAMIRDATGSTLAPAALGWSLGDVLAIDAVLSRAAVFGTPLTAGWQAEIARGAAAICPVSATDLMPDLTGPALGKRLKTIETLWLQSDLRLSKADLLN